MALDIELPSSKIDHGGNAMRPAEAEKPRSFRTSRYVRFFRRSILRDTGHSNKRGAFVGVDCLCLVRCYSTDSKPRAGLMPCFPANDLSASGCRFPRTAHPTPNVAGFQWPNAGVHCGQTVPDR